MISGHIATTLVAKRHLPQTPWWLLGVSAYALDLAMFGLVAAGVEQLEGQPEATPPSMSTSVIDMTYSHDLLPTLLWTALFAGVLFTVTRRGRLTLICTALFVGHWACDFVSGYGHFLFGSDSTPIGLDLLSPELRRCRRR